MLVSVRSLPPAVLLSCDRRSSFLPMNLAYPGCLASVVCSVRVHPTLAGRPVRRADANHRSLPTVHEQTATHAGSSKIHWHTAPGSAMSPTPEALTGTPESRQSKFLGPGPGADTEDNPRVTGHLHSELKEQIFERVVGSGVASRRRTRKRESLKRPGFELD